MAFNLSRPLAKAQIISSCRQSSIPAERSHSCFTYICWRAKAWYQGCNQWQRHTWSCLVAVSTGGTNPVSSAIEAMEASVTQSSMLWLPGNATMAVLANFGSSGVVMRYDDASSVASLPSCDAMQCQVYYIRSALAPKPAGIFIYVSLRPFANRKFLQGSQIINQGTYGWTGISMSRR